MAMTVSMARALGPLATGGPDPGERRGFAGDLRLGGRDRGGHRDVARDRPPGPGQCRGDGPAPPGPDHPGVGGRARSSTAPPGSASIFVPRGYLQRRDVPGAGLADRGQEDPRPGDGRAPGRSPGRSDLEPARRDRLPDRGRDRGGRHGQGVRRARGARPGRPRSPEDGLRPERGDRADRPGLRGGRRSTSRPSRRAGRSPPA